MSEQSLEELLEQQRKLAEVIQQRRAAEREKGIEEILKIMKTLELTPADLGIQVATAAPARAKRAPRDSGPAGTAARDGRGGKPGPKYKDPKSENTWSGRGLRPKWFKDALAEGVTVEQMLIAG